MAFWDFLKSDDEEEEATKKEVLAKPFPGRPQPASPTLTPPEPSALASKVNAPREQPEPSTTTSKSSSSSERNVFSNVIPKPSRENLSKLEKDYQEDTAKLKDMGYNTSDIEDKLDQFRQAYKEKTDRNEMLSLAQMIGQSIAKLGAARAGLRGGFYAVPDKMPSVDYDARSDRALKEYQADVTRGDRQSTERRLGAQENRERLKDSLLGKKDALNAAQQEFGAGERAYYQGAQNAQDSNARMSKESEVDKRNQARLKEAEVRESLRDIRTEEKSAADKLTKARAAMAIIASPSAKDGDKAKARGILADAGVAPDAIDSAIKKGDEAKWFGTDWTIVADELNKDPAINSLAARLKELAEAKANTRTIREPEAASVAPASSPKRMTREQLTTYAKQYNMNEKAAADYLRSQGFSLE